MTGPGFFSSRPFDGYCFICPRVASSARTCVREGQVPRRQQVFFREATSGIQNQLAVLCFMALGEGGVRGCGCRFLFYSVAAPSTKTAEPNPYLPSTRVCVGRVRLSVLRCLVCFFRRRKRPARRSRSVIPRSLPSNPRAREAKAARGRSKTHMDGLQPSRAIFCNTGGRLPDGCIFVPCILLWPPHRHRVVSRPTLGCKSY